jgi:hypothetical protein
MTLPLIGARRFTTRGDTGHFSIAGTEESQTSTRRLSQQARARLVGGTGQRLDPARGGGKVGLSRQILGAEQCRHRLSGADAVTLDHVQTLETAGDPR